MSDSEGFFVGTYNGACLSDELAGNGIFYLRLDSRTGAFSPVAGVASCSNPSYLAWGPDKKIVYAVREVTRRHRPELLSFRVGADGNLAPLNRVDVIGELPCHLSVNAGGTLLASAQYMSGNVLLFRLEPDGRIGGLLKNIQHSGSGPDPARQRGPHAHFAGFLGDPEELVAVDLGLDRVFSYSLPQGAGSDFRDPSPDRENSSALPGGVGPRHLAVGSGGAVFYVFCAMHAMIFVLRRNLQFWNRIQAVRAFDVLDGAVDSGAAIKLSPDGRFLYVSERARSMIAVFAVERESGMLSPVQKIASGGQGPRDISISASGRHLVVANQQENCLTGFFRDPESGRLGFSGHGVQLPGPACILF